MKEYQKPSIEPDWDDTRLVVTNHLGQRFVLGEARAHEVFDASMRIYQKWKQGMKLMSEFESMRDMAGLRALSKVSLERELSDKEYARMMELGKKAGLKK